MPRPVPRELGTPEHLTALYDRVARLERRKQGGFDPNADPVVIGQTAIADATGPTGSSSPTTDGAVAIGRDAHTENSAAVAIGDSAFAAGQYSTVVGDHADAEGIKWDIAIGHVARASWATGAQQSIAIGANAHAGGTTTDTLRDIAIGVFSVADGGSTVAIGDAATASANGSTAIGFGASASGGGDTAIGPGAQTTSSDAVAFGPGAQGNADQCVAIGTSAVVNASEGMALGWNATVGVGHDGSSAIGFGASTTATGQIMMGNQRMYVEIAGDSTLGQQVGLVLTDTVSPHTRYIIQVVSGALALSVAP